MTDRQPEAEAPDAVTAARHKLESAFKAFRKRASAANDEALLDAMNEYQAAQYQAECVARQKEFGI